jgi:uncharacterized membrane protein
MKRASFGTVVAILGGCLVALGFAWLLAQNWAAIPAAVKILVLAAATGGALVAGALLGRRGDDGASAALLMLAGLLWTLSVFLVAQIFSTDASLQGSAWLLLLSLLGVLAIAYGFESRATLVVGLAEVLVWLLLQFLALLERGSDFSSAVLALLFLGAGVGFYALKLLHRERFASLYRLWTVLYFLLFAYVLSFRDLTPELWSGSGEGGAATTFVVAVWAVALVAAVVGAALSRGRVALREPVAVAALVVLLLAFLFTSRYVVGESFGVCRSQPCYQLSEESCDTSPACLWTQEQCQPRPLLPEADACSGFAVAEDCRDAGCRWGPAFGAGCEQVETWCNEQPWMSCAEQLQRCARDGYAFADCVPFADDCWRANLDRDSCVALLAACRVEVGCTADATLYQSCAQIGSAERCAEQERCTWLDGSCQDVDPCAANASPDACSADPLCTWTRQRSMRDDVSPAAWALWIAFNVVFVGLVLAVIGYGSWSRHDAVINLGIAFFALDVVTRYVGFVIDFWGYTSLSLVFIVGGVVLLYGGYRLEKWRRRLVDRT